MLQRWGEAWLAEASAGGFGAVDEDVSQACAEVAENSLKKSDHSR
jgi:hypothetical protein